VCVPENSCSSHEPDVHMGENPRPVGLLRHDQQGARENAAFGGPSVRLAPLYDVASVLPYDG